MSLFSSTQPSIRARILPKFPAQVVAGSGITITKSGGVYTFEVPETVQAAVTVAALPTAGTVGRRRVVTDSTTTTFNAIVSGGGANKIPVWDDGTNWRVG